MTEVIALFNNKGGVGKTMLVHHLAHMVSRLGITTLAVDLDPQANLTSAFFDDARLEDLEASGQPATIRDATSVRSIGLPGSAPITFSFRSPLTCPACVGFPNVGPTLRQCRATWHGNVLPKVGALGLDVPRGVMSPTGYVVTRYCLPACASTVC